MVAGLGKIAAKATNTLKNVAAKAAQKTSRAKRKSDEVYNARRRAKRKLDFVLSEKIAKIASECKFLSKNKQKTAFFAVFFGIKMPKMFV